MHVVNKKEIFSACANWMFESHNDTRLRLSGKQTAVAMKKKKTINAQKKPQFCKSRTMYLLFWMNKVYNFIHCTYCTTPFAGNQLIKSMCTTLLSRIFLLILIYFFKFYTQHTHENVCLFSKKRACVMIDWLPFWLMLYTYIFRSCIKFISE